MRFIVKASTSGAPELGCDNNANFSGDRHSGEGGPRLEGAVAGRLCRGVSLELRRWLRVGFTGVAVDKRASALDGDKASWIAAICSAFPTPGKGWSQTWSARRRDAPVLVERCESPEALRADRVEAADWGRCIGILCLGVVAPRGLCEGLPRACVGGRVLPRRRRSFVNPLDAARRWPLLRCNAERGSASHEVLARLDFRGLCDGSEVSL